MLGGVVKPMTYTGNAMHNFAYAHRVLQQPGLTAPNAFLLPMSKTAGWWRKDWMERHTYFLPRYDGAGTMRNFTGAPLCRPTPVASTGRCTVVSKRKTEPDTPIGCFHMKSCNMQADSRS